MRRTAPVLTATILLLASLTAGVPAWAHGGDETKEGYLLVQQALGYLADDDSASGIDLAMEKVGDALETDDQEGVDVATLTEGQAALEQGDVKRATTLLQDSIREALAMLPTATGNETGTHLILPALEGRPDLRAQDWLLVGVSALALLGGGWLTVRFRPRDNVRALRSMLLTEPPVGSREYPERGGT